MVGQFNAREIREEDAFKDAKKKLQQTAKRLDEIISGVTWVMARKPESFPKVPDLELYVAKTDAAPDAPAFYIWFTFDNTTVSLLLIEQAREPE